MQVRERRAPPRRAAAAAGGGTARRSRPAPAGTPLSIASTSLPRQSASQVRAEQVRRQPLAVVGVELLDLRRPRRCSPSRRCARSPAPARPPDARRSRSPRTAGSPARRGARRGPGDTARTARPACRATPAPRALRAAATSARCRPAPWTAAVASISSETTWAMASERSASASSLQMSVAFCDAEPLQAGQLEALRELLVVLLPGRLQHRAHVGRVVLAELHRVRDGQLGIDDRAARERQQHAEPLVGAAGPLRRQDVQVLGEDLGARDPPVVLGLGLGDRLLGPRLLRRRSATAGTARSTSRPAPPRR